MLLSSDEKSHINYRFNELNKTLLLPVILYELAFSRLQTRVKYLIRYTTNVTEVKYPKKEK